MTNTELWVLAICWTAFCFSLPYIFTGSRPTKKVVRFHEGEEESPRYLMSNKPSKKQEKEKSIPLNYMEKTFFVDHKMPCCGAESFSEGPSGGITTNIKCGGCGEMYNVCLGGLSQNEGPYPKIIEKIQRREQ